MIHFSHLCLQVNLRQRYKNKRYRFLDTFLLRSLAEREGFEPPEPRSSTVFKTAAIDHSATSPKDKSIAYFCNHQIFLQKILKIFILHITTTCASAYYKKHSVSVIFEEIALCHYIFAKIALCDASQKPHHITRQLIFARFWMATLLTPLKITPL